MFSYICPEIAKEFCFKQGDIVVSVPAKCGTHWCMFLAYSILSRGDISFDDIYERVPWLEFKWSPKQTLEDRIKYLETKVDYGLDGKGRIFKTHLDIAPGPLKFSSCVKYIFCFRNPLDVIISVHSFLHLHTDEFFQEWGMSGLKDRLRNIDDAIDLMLEGVFPKDIFSAYQRAWNVRNYENVLLVHFSNLKNDLRAEVKRLSQFLGVELTDAEMNQVEDHCSFQWMKANEQKFNLNSLGVFCQDGTKIPILKSSGLLRKGDVNEHIDVLSEKQRERIIKSAKTQILDPALFEFIFK